jgi:hypothetical protein
LIEVSQSPQALYQSCHRDNLSSSFARTKFPKGAYSTVRFPFPVKTAYLTGLSNAEPDVVTIEAIDEQGMRKDFVVHKAVICFYSPFFRSAFNGCFSEGASQSMIFPTFPLEAFGTFVDWIYSQKIADADGTAVPNIHELVYLYIVAGQLLVPKLQNSIIDLIVEVVSETNALPAAVFHHLYQETTESSPLRRIFVDLYVQYMGKIEVEAFFPREMLVDIVNASKSSTTASRRSSPGRR